MMIQNVKLVKIIAMNVYCLVKLVVQFVLLQVNVRRVMMVIINLFPNGTVYNVITLYVQLVKILIQIVKFNVNLIVKHVQKITYATHVTMVII